MATYAGVDLGATNIRAVVGDESGAVLASRRTGTPQGPNWIAVTEAVLSALRGACEEAPDSSPTTARMLVAPRSTPA